MERRIDPADLVRALRATGTIDADTRLLDLEAVSIGIGATADTLLLSATWSGPGPASFVAKLPSADENAARTAASMGLYEREGRFYAELAPRTALSVPRFLGVLDYDGEPTGVLLEDLSALQPGDQFSDVPVLQLRLLREQLVELQAPFWEDPELAAASTPSGWLHRRLGVPIPGILERMERSWTLARDELAAGFDPEETSQIDRFVAGAGAWAETIGGPFSLTHHDFRVDNVLFDTADPSTVVVLDWQTVGWGAPMFDVAYLLGTSVGPETRRRLERDEVARHVDDLAARGVVWDGDEAWTAYRQASFATLLMLVPPTGSVKRSDRSDAMFRRLLRHGARMALDLEADEFLPVPVH